MTGMRTWAGGAGGTWGGTIPPPPGAGSSKPPGKLGSRLRPPSRPPYPSISARVPVGAAGIVMRSSRLAEERRIWATS